MSTIYVVGMGPGREDMMTALALDVLRKADVIIGYPVYLDLLGEEFSQKEFLSTPMRKETERCRMCFEEAEKGNSYAARGLSNLENASISTIHAFCKTLIASYFYFFNQTLHIFFYKVILTIK